MMEYNKLIAEMSLSDEVEGFYVLKAAYPKTTATGKPFGTILAPSPLQMKAML